MFLHMLYDSVHILEEADMAKLIHLVVSDRLYLHHAAYLF